PFISDLRTLRAAAGSPPYIGVTWRAGTAPEDQNSVTWLLYKSVGIEALGETLRDTTGTLVALQRQPRPGELEAFMKAVRRPIAEFTAFNEELGGMLALLSLLDDYVGVSNTN